MSIKVGLAQIAPVWLDKAKTLKKVEKWICHAADKKCDLVVFGECIVPGYPFWVPLTGGAEWNSPMQKELFSLYLKESVDIEKGDLKSVCALCKEKSIATYLGCIERPMDRGGKSCYCSLVYISKKGKIESNHRKIMPTFHERLVWSIGDGNGLRVHDLGAFRVGGLNCWENWIPLARSSLYAQGEDLHVAVWPGSEHNTRDITRFIAIESRSFVVSVSGFLSKKQVEELPDLPYKKEIVSKINKEFLASGGSCVAGPDGKWILDPKKTGGSEGLFVVDLEVKKVREERQNFCPSGSYSRPDVLNLKVNRKRQKPANFEE